MKINVAIGSPLYEVSYDYGKKRDIKHIKEQCKKNLLLRITIGGVTEEFSRQLFKHIVTRLRNSVSSDGLQELSLCDWGTPYSFNEDTSTLVDCICVPKDFDSLEIQKKQLLKEIRAIIRDVKKNIPSEPTVLDI